jgi:hypothetical protein
MTSKNDITGDSLTTRAASDKYRDGWERIFGQKDAKNQKTLSDYISQVQQDEGLEDKKQD